MYGIRTSQMRITKLLFAVFSIFIIILYTYHFHIIFIIHSIISSSPLNIFGLEFDYLINNYCEKPRFVRTIQIVTSNVVNLEARNALRQAYPKEELKTLGIYRVFLLAKINPRHSKDIQNEIIEENLKHNDIIQGDFRDVYRNLTYKHIMGLNWAVTNCVADYIIKMDDDIIVDLYSLRKLIDAKENEIFDIIGFLFWKKTPTREKRSKWFVTKEEYEPDVYPPYASGWLYVIKRVAAVKLLSTMDLVRFFWIDDVLVTGIMAQKANIRLGDINHFFRISPEYMECCVKKKLECGFIVFPSHNNYRLNIAFQNHSKLCDMGKCTKNSVC